MSTTRNLVRFAMALAVAAVLPAAGAAETPLVLVRELEGFPAESSRGEAETPTKIKQLLWVSQEGVNAVSAFPLAAGQPLPDRFAALEPWRRAIEQEVQALERLQLRDERCFIALSPEPSYVNSWWELERALSLEGRFTTSQLVVRGTLESVEPGLVTAGETRGVGVPAQLVTLRVNEVVSDDQRSTSKGATVLFLSRQGPLELDGEALCPRMKPEHPRLEPGDRILLGGDFLDRTAGLLTAVAFLPLE